MFRKSTISLLGISLLLSAGCTPPSSAVVAPAVQCEPEPAAPAWMMQPVTPNFDQRLQRILPVSPPTPTPAPSP